ncbi:hypothetical protein D9M69_712950 [compost metagenome]
MKKPSAMLSAEMMTAVAAPPTRPKSLASAKKLPLSRLSITSGTTRKNRMNCHLSSLGSALRLFS